MLGKQESCRGRCVGKETNMSKPARSSVECGGALAMAARVGCVPGRRLSVETTDRVPAPVPVPAPCACTLSCACACALGGFPAAHQPSLSSPPDPFPVSRCGHWPAPMFGQSLAMCSPIIHPRESFRHCWHIHVNGALTLSVLGWRRKLGDCEVCSLRLHT